MKRQEGTGFLLDKNGFFTGYTAEEMLASVGRTQPAGTTTEAQATNAAEHDTERGTA